MPVRPDPSRDTIDIIAVQNSDLLDRLQTELVTGDRHTGTGAATFILPDLAVEWEHTPLTTGLPNADQLAAVTARLSEPVTREDHSSNSLVSNSST